ncbi:hypothetical protein HYH03_010215 [Edaphochlamys debaryana]|uniref:Uncharacterized protein n=1 Tax=Edaphochlamys debaryana TaxID=47281 RepID=A0A836BXP1_9CHLO|nr:hypothetical protein HYH03_010215 [Edaphochlamys debaryana]|eukprot:KAG2491428.1 hypothetical protein HYH03_010215 [Edaphochlamys debaryana]
MTWEPDSCLLRRLSGNRASRCLASLAPVFFVGDSITRYQYLALLHFLVAGKYQHPYDTDKCLTDAHTHDGASTTQYNNLWKYAHDQVERHGPKGASLSYTVRRQDHVELSRLSLPAPGTNKTASLFYYYTSFAAARDYKAFYSWISRYIRQLLPSNVAEASAAPPPPSEQSTGTASGPYEVVIDWNATLSPPKPLSCMGAPPLRGCALASGGGGGGDEAGVKAGSGGRAAGNDPEAGVEVGSGGGSGEGDDETRADAPEASDMGAAGEVQVDEGAVDDSSTPAAQPREQPAESAARSSSSPAATANDTSSAPQAPRALVILNVCAHYGNAPALVPDVKAALAAALDKLPPGTQLVWRSCTTPQGDMRRLVDAAEAEIGASAAAHGVPVLDLRAVAMAAVRQGLVTTWDPDTVHFHQWVYGEFNDILLNILCPAEP